MVTSTFVILGNVKGLSVASEELLRGNILEEHEDALHDAGGGGGGTFALMFQRVLRGNILEEHQNALHAAGGHVWVDLPEGVRLVHCHLGVVGWCDDPG